MRKNIVLAGVGGQGLLSIAAVLGEAARSEGLNLKQAEVHGMAQRGGVVQSHIRYSDQLVHSDLIREGTADLILSLEPMEALRYVEFLSPEGAIVTSTIPVENIPNYPSIEGILSELAAYPRLAAIDADALAREAGSPRCMNMVMLGAGSGELGLPQEAIIGGIKHIFSSKSTEIIEMNLRGFQLGLEAAAKSL